MKKMKAQSWSEKQKNKRRENEMKFTCQVRKIMLMYFFFLRYHLLYSLAFHLFSKYRYGNENYTHTKIQKASERYLCFVCDKFICYLFIATMVDVIIIAGCLLCCSPFFRWINFCFLPEMLPLLKVDVKFLINCN